VWAYDFQNGWHKPVLEGSPPTGLTGQVGPYPNGVAFGKNRLFAYASTQKCGTGGGVCQKYYDGVRTYSQPSTSYPNGRLFNEGSLSAAASITSDLVITSQQGFANSNFTESNTVDFYSAMTGERVLGGGTSLSVSSGGLPATAVTPTNGTLAQPFSGLVWLQGNAVRKYVQQPNCSGTNCITYPQIGSVPSSGVSLDLRLLDNSTMLATGVRTGSAGRYWWVSYDLGATWTALEPLPLNSTSWSGASVYPSRDASFYSGMVFLYLDFQTGSGSETHLYGVQSISTSSQHRVSYYGRVSSVGRAAAVVALAPAPTGGTREVIFALSLPSGGSALAQTVKCWTLPTDQWRSVQITAPLQVAVRYLADSRGAINGQFYAEALAVASDSSAVSYSWRRTTGTTVTPVGGGLRTLVASCPSASTVDVTASSGSAQVTWAWPVSYGASFTGVPADRYVDDGETVTINAPTLTAAAFGGPFGSVLSWQWEERTNPLHVYPPTWITRSTSSVLSLPNVSCNNAYRYFRLTMTVARSGQTNAVWVFPVFQVRVRPVVTITQQPGDRSVCVLCGVVQPAMPLSSPPAYPMQHAFFRVAYTACPAELAAVTWQIKRPGGQWADASPNDPLLQAPDPNQFNPPDMLALWVLYNPSLDTEIMGSEFRAKLQFAGIVVYSNAAQLIKGTGA
jgi:hypothetical protein